MRNKLDFYVFITYNQHDTPWGGCWLIDGFVRYRPNLFLGFHFCFLSLQSVTFIFIRIYKQTLILCPTLYTIVLFLVNILSSSGCQYVEFGSNTFQLKNGDCDSERNYICKGILTIDLWQIPDLILKLNLSV